MSAELRERSAARLLASPELEHDRAQAALAASFSVTAAAAPEALLDEASLPLFGIAELSAREQAQELADLLTNHLCLRPERHDHRALLIDHALVSRHAHPIQIAVIGHELARRAGVASFVGSCEGEPWTVLRGDNEMALVGPASIAGPLEPRTVQGRCAHQVARAVLTQLRELAPPESVPRAERLLAALPGCRRS
jgi:hypothetical protein